mgnify:CR=1 FL=1
MLDEATAGLDPIARDEVLDLLRDFMAEGDRGILMSTHITYGGCCAHRAHDVPHEQGYDQADAQQLQKSTPQNGGLSPAENTPEMIVGSTIGGVSVVAIAMAVAMPVITRFGMTKAARIVPVIV